MFKAGATRLTSFDFFISLSLLSPPPRPLTPSCRPRARWDHGTCACGARLCLFVCVRAHVGTPSEATRLTYICPPVLYIWCSLTYRTVTSGSYHLFTSALPYEYPLMAELNWGLLWPHSGGRLYKRFFSFFLSFCLSFSFSHRTLVFSHRHWPLHL